MAKILIVEDDDALRVTLERMVRSAGHDPQPASGRRQVTDAIAAAKYDVVLTDILMPDFDGLEVIRMVRTVKPGCPIIAASGGGEHLPAPAGLRLASVFGADVVLNKPFTMSELIDAIARVV
jgi:two-component system, sensor histidine kinase